MHQLPRRCKDQQDPHEKATNNPESLAMEVRMTSLEPPPMRMMRESR